MEKDSTKKTPVKETDTGTDNEGVIDTSTNIRKSDDSSPSPTDVTSAKEDSTTKTPIDTGISSNIRKSDASPPASTDIASVKEDSRRKTPIMDTGISSNIRKSDVSSPSPIASTKEDSTKKTPIVNTGISSNIRKSDASSPSPIASTKEDSTKTTPKPNTGISSNIRKSDASSPSPIASTKEDSTKTTPKPNTGISSNIRKSDASSPSPIASTKEDSTKKTPIVNTGISSNRRKSDASSPSPIASTKEDSTKTNPKPNTGISSNIRKSDASSPSPIASTKEDLTKKTPIVNTGISSNRRKSDASSPSPIVSTKEDSTKKTPIANTGISSNRRKSDASSPSPIASTKEDSTKTTPKPNTGISSNIRKSDASSPSPIASTKEDSTKKTPIVNTGISSNRRKSDASSPSPIDIASTKEDSRKKTPLIDTGISSNVRKSDTSSPSPTDIASTKEDSRRKTPVIDTGISSNIRKSDASSPSRTDIASAEEDSNIKNPVTETDTGINTERVLKTSFDFRKSDVSSPTDIASAEDASEMNNLVIIPETDIGVEGALKTSFNFRRHDTTSDKEDFGATCPRKSDEPCKIRRSLDTENSVDIQGSIHLETLSKAQVVGIPIKNLPNGHDEVKDDDKGAKNPMPTGLIRGEYERWIILKSRLTYETQPHTFDITIREDVPGNCKHIRYREPINERHWDEWGNKHTARTKRLKDIKILSRSGGTMSLEEHGPIYRPYDDAKWDICHDGLFSPVFNALEALDEFYKPYLRKIKHGLDLISLPFGYFGEVGSRIKGCFWVMSRTSRILKGPEFTNEQRQQIKTLLDRSFVTFDETIASLLIECRRTLKDLREQRKLCQSYKYLMKDFLMFVDYYAQDDDDIDNPEFFQPRTYCSGEIPRDPVTWENIPTWERTEYPVGDDEDQDVILEETAFSHHWYQYAMKPKEYRYFKLHECKPAYDFLWMSDDECFVKSPSEEEWYDYSRFDSDLKISTMNMIHESARDVAAVSRQWLFEANDWLARKEVVQDADRRKAGFVVENLWKKMKKNMPYLPHAQRARGELKRLHRLWATVEQYYLNKSKMTRLCKLLSHTVTFLSRHRRLVGPLAYCVTNEEAKMCILKKSFFVGYPLQLLLKNYFCQHYKYQRVRFAMTRPELVIFAPSLQPEWKNYVVVWRKLRNLVATSHGVYWRWEFNYAKPSQCCYWIFKKIWKIPEPPPPPLKWPMLRHPLDTIPAPLPSPEERMRENYVLTTSGYNFSL